MSDNDYPPGPDAPPPGGPPPEFGQPPGGEAPPYGAPPPPGGQPPYGGPADPYADPAWQQQQQQGYGYAPQAPTPGLSIASLICGILSMPTCMCYGCPSLICGILAVVFGGMTLGAIKRGEASEKGKGLSIAGIVCGCVGILLSVLFWVLGAAGIILDEM